MIRYQTIQLEGGPSDFPTSQRTRRVLGRTAGDEKIKVEYYGGHEHFERVDALSGEDDSQVIVYRWTTRTEIAE